MKKNDSRHYLVISNGDEVIFEAPSIEKLKTMIAKCIRSGQYSTEDFKDCTIYETVAELKVLANPLIDIKFTPRKLEC